MKDRWRWSLEGCGDFSVASVRKVLDDSLLLAVSFKTRWIKVVPIKVNILAWKVRLDSLPTRLNISKREVFRKILLWWEINVTMVSSYDEWLEWLLNIRLHSKHKKLFEGVCYVMWWKTVSLIEEGRKTVSGIEERKPVSRVEVGRRSVENRADMVMINVGEIAELLQVRVIVTDMPGFMQVHAFRCARQTFDSLEKFSPRQIALNMKKDYEKAKIRWSLEGDENSKYFHGVLNNKRSQLAIRRAYDFRINWDSQFPKRLSLEQVTYLERHVTYDVIKKAWKDIDHDVVVVVTSLSNRLSDIISDLINEIQLAFFANRQILDGPFILNELLSWCKSKKLKTIIFKVDFKKAFDLVRCDYLDDVLNTFGFDNGRPASEFQFHKGSLKLSMAFEVLLIVPDIRLDIPLVLVLCRVSGSSLGSKRQAEGVCAGQRPSSAGRGPQPGGRGLAEAHMVEGKDVKASIPEICALETCKQITIAYKMRHDSIDYSYRRSPRGVVEEEQQNKLHSLLTDIILPQMHDRCVVVESTSHLLFSCSLAQVRSKVLRLTDSSKHSGHITASVVFPAATVVMTLAQQGEAIRGIQEHLLGVPIQEELTALRVRVDTVEAKNASLRATIRTMEAVKTITRNNERLARIEIERQLASVQESRRQDREDFKKLKEFVISLQFDDRTGFAMMGFCDDIYVIGGVVWPGGGIRVNKVSDVNVLVLGNDNERPVWKKVASMTRRQGVILGCAELRI
ncbi:RNA-directed DNA polymerase, eukaryota [Tanacetum coccineum]